MASTASMQPEPVPQVLPPMAADPAKGSGPNYLPLNLYYPGLKKVHESPPIYTCENFLTDEECQAFIDVASPLLQRSKTHAIAGTQRFFERLPNSAIR